MGGCFSRPKQRDPSNRGNRPAPAPKPWHPVPRPGGPDPGLADTHQYIGPLGKGGMGEIGLFLDRKTGERVAIKLIKRPIPRPVAVNLLREILLLAELGAGHVNIVNAKEVLLTRLHVCLVMEVAEGGNLTAYVSRCLKNPSPTGLFLPEDEARYFFKQFIDAVAFCHANKVAHRDLKLDNTLLDNNQPARLKLCDFGFAKGWDSDANMHTNIGTPAYMSPAQLHTRAEGEGYSGTAVDVWAAGVMLVLMLLGMFPYDHIENPNPNTREAQMEVWAAQVANRWQEVPPIAKLVNQLSPVCVDLIDRMFILDEKQRITLAQVREHPWVKQRASPTYAAAEAQLAADQQRLTEQRARRRVSQAKKKERAKRIEAMLDKAGLRPPLTADDPSSPEVRIDLSDAAISDTRASCEMTMEAIPESSSMSQLKRSFNDLQAAAVQQEDAAASPPQSPGTQRQQNGRRKYANGGVSSVMPVQQRQQRQLLAGDRRFVNKGSSSGAESNAVAAGGRMPADVMAARHRAADPSPGMKMPLDAQ